MSVGESSDIPNCMNNAASQVAAARPDAVPLEHEDSQNRHADVYPRAIHNTGVDPNPMNDLAHALRQPLSTIESLAYYLELTNDDDQVCRHLRQIRMLVDRASRILDRAAA
jgi:nitrogen-specific signal transduction histidine kinase